MNDHNPDAREVEASERQRFEAWWTRTHPRANTTNLAHFFKTSKYGQYEDAKIELQWSAWQAATRAPLPEAAVVLPEDKERRWKAEYAEFLSVYRDCYSDDLSPRDIAFNVWQSALSMMEADRQSRAQQPTREADA